MFSIAQGIDPPSHEVFNALSSAMRLEINELLSERHRTISELAIHFGVSLPAVLYHMKVLQEAEIVSRKRVGRCVEYALVRRTVITPVMNSVRDLGCWIQH